MSTAIMVPEKSSVVVRYIKPGTQPPLFLAGSFAAWEPQEMQYTTDENNEHEFYKEIEVVEGKEYQYKFRVGLGEWWVLNEDSPVVTDDIGNRNNLLTVPIKEKHIDDSKQNTEPVETKTAETPSMTEENIADTTHDSIEETMGTRDTDDVLFAEEIVKDIKGKETPELALPEPQEPHSTPAILELEENENITLPTLVVEHTENDTSLKGDISPEDAVDQKKAQFLEPQDVESDQGIARGKTPELADIAAEVADSAAFLDQDPPTPPVSDEEAGRIGYRRMSSTPMPEVANTAAEVADVAAELDAEEDEDDHDWGMIPGVDDKEPDMTPTPPNEKIPLFEHELCLPPDPKDIKPCDHKEFDAAQYILDQQKPAKQPDFDPNDPNIKPFPTDREGIMEHLRLLQERMPEDQTRVDDLNGGSPIMAAVGRSSRSSFSAISPAALVPESSNGLQPIPEGYDDGLAALASAISNSKGSQVKSSSENASENIKPVFKISSEPEGPGSGQTDGADTSTKEESNDANKVTTHTNGVHEEQSISNDQESASGTDTAVQTHVVEVPVIEQSMSLHDILQPEHQSPILLGAQDPVNEDEDIIAEMNSLKEPEEGHKVDIEEVIEPDTPSSAARKALDGVCGEGEHVIPSPTTPLVVGNRQLGEEEEVHSITTLGDSPNITVQPATPKAGLNRQLGDDESEGGIGPKITVESASEDSNNRADIPTDSSAAKSTGVEEDLGQPQITFRKQQHSPTRSKSPERPHTPSSIQSASKQVKGKNKNFLSAFWRVVFVDWIGGLIARLCGGGRRNTFLAVGAITVVAIAPALYHIV